MEASVVHNISLISLKKKKKRFNFIHQIDRQSVCKTFWCARTL